MGQQIKVLLPGERPWVEVVDERSDAFKGRIINKLFHEHSEHEQARFMKDNFDKIDPLPQLHHFKKGDELWFTHGSGNDVGWYVPLEEAYDHS